MHLEENVAVFKKILLALDGSELARRALPYVSEIAREQGSEVYVLEVIDPLEVVRRELGDGAGDGEALGERAAALHRLQVDEAARELEAARGELEAAGARTVVTLIREGAPAAAIVDAATELGCDAIAMGARGHSGMAREAIGSVAEAVVLNAAGMAVLLVGPRRAGTHGPTVFGMRTISPPPEAAPEPPGAPAPRRP